MVTASLHFWWELYRQSGSDAFIPAGGAGLSGAGMLARVERIPEGERPCSRVMMAIAPT